MRIVEKEINIKTKYPQCYFISKGRLSGFYYLKHLVEEDREFIQGLFDKKDYKSLEFMENFYTIIRKANDTASQKCIMSRTPYLKTKEIKKIKSIK